MNFVTVCKKGLGKLQGIDVNGNHCTQKVHLKKGGTLEVCGHKKMSKKAIPYREKIVGDETKRVESNIKTVPALHVKTLARDMYFEDLLQGGRYCWPDMFLSRNPYGEAPLTALLLFVTPESCQVRVTIPGDIPETEISYCLPDTKYHRIPIVGLYPSRKNKVKIELLNEKKEVLDSRIVPIKTRILPTDLQNIIKPFKIAENPAFKNIMISGGVDIKTMAFDKLGAVRYFLRRKVRGYGIFPISNGHFVYMEREVAVPSYSNPQTSVYHDMDYLGRVYRTYLSEKGVHHTLEENENGNFLTGSNTMMEHTEDVVVEIDRNTGEVVWELKIEDLFDEKYKNMMDWAHVNSAVYYPKDDTVLISLRNVHSVLSVDYKTKELRWLLSDVKFWKGTAMVDKLLKPVGDVKWTYQQHAAYELDEDFDGNPDTKHIIIFDNHWNKRRKVKSFDKDPLSYVSIYTVNEKEGTVELFKRFGCPKTRIRANGIYCKEAGRVYSMAGCYAEEEKECMGGVYEYDFQTGELVSEYGVKPGYFRAYEFAPDMEELAKPMPVTKDYMVGHTKRPYPVKKEEAEKLSFSSCRTLINRKLKYQVQEQLLFVHYIDHDLLKVYFVGEKGTYAVDFDDTYQTMEIFKDRLYYYTMEFDNLPPDHYKIYLNITGEIVNSGKYITKK